MFAPRIGLFLDQMSGGLPLLTRLTGYWKLDEASGTRTDSSASGANLSEVIAAVSNGAGKIGNAAVFAFNAANGYLRSQSTKLSLSNPGAGGWTRSWTCAFWFKTTNDANNMILMSHGGANGAAVSKGAADTTHLTVVVGNSSFAAVVPTTTDGVFHLVIWGFDAVTGKSYIRFDNGTEVQNSGGVSVPYDDGDFRLGTSMAFEATSSRFEGNIDEVGLWSTYKLSDAECSALWNAGAGRTYPFVGA